MKSGLAAKYENMVHRGHSFTRTAERGDRLFIVRRAHRASCKSETTEPPSMVADSRRGRG
jgi:hypothetical protein